MATFKSYNPYDNSLNGEFPYANKEEVEKVIGLLKKGKDIQKNMSSDERANMLESFALMLKEHSEQIAGIVTKEVGKTIQDSRVEMQRSYNTVLAASHEARMIRGEVIDADAYPPKRNKYGVVFKKPLGIVLCITPFNFPINLSMHKIAPALAAGNCVFFKPGPHNYESGKLLVELAHKAGIPEECIQFCYPDIPELSEVIAGDDIQCVSFTGGTKTADAIAKNAGRKKLLLELGGNDPLIVMPDADIELAVNTTINQRFATAGQRCTASKRLFIHADVYEQFKNSIVEKTKKLVIGDPTDPTTFVGPVVSKNAADVIEKRIQDAIAMGATCLAGNKREGNIIHPTILENVPLDSEIIADETFGPVVPLVKFNEIDEVIKIVNSAQFGLQSGVFTNNIKIIEKLFEELEVGALAVNDGPGFRAEHLPFGGVKDSGLGREGVRYAMEEMMYMKTLIM